MKRIRPAPMGRAYRYQRRLTHIILSVAEREAKSGLVTRVEEPATAPESAKAAKAKKSAPAAEKKPAVKKDAGKKTAPTKTAKKSE
jgi:large subunit ribosomal protein L22